MSRQLMWIHSKSQILVPQHRWIKLVNARVHTFDYSTVKISEKIYTQRVFKKKKKNKDQSQFPLHKVKRESHMNREREREREKERK